MASPRRRSVVVEGLGHGEQPIPAASRIGPMVWSGGVAGVVPGSQTPPEALEDEAAQLFRNIEAIVTAAGGELDDVIRVTVHTADRAATGSAVNAAWVQAFPDPDSRPARHTVDRALPGALRLQGEFIAVVDEAGS